MKNNITFTLLFLLCVTKIFATDYFVNPNSGNDGANGQSENNAFRSLWKISSLYLQPGDNVYLMNGTHRNSGQTVLILEESGTAENWITIQNYPGHTPLIEFDSWNGIDILNGASYIKLKGLRVKGARTKITLEDALEQPASCALLEEGNPSGFYNGTGINVVGPNLVWSNAATTGDEIPHHITVEDCEVFDCTSSGMAFQQADYITVKNNKVYNNCWYTIYGTSGINFYQFINVDGTTGFHNEVSNNLMYGNQLKVPQVPYCAYYDGNGFIIDDFVHLQKFNYKDDTVVYGAYSAKTLVQNNVAVENGGSGLHFFIATNTYIYNNTMVNNAFQNDGVNGNAELRLGASTNMFVKNNIMKGTRIHKMSGNTNLNYTHNYQDGPEIFEDFLDNACEGCISGELNFLNEDVNAVNPYITSFAGLLGDAGTTLPVEALPYDFLLNPRLQDATFDIGAYELLRCSATDNIELTAKVYLEDLYDAETNVMVTDSIISAVHPFLDLHNGSEIVKQEVLDSTGLDAIVSWVLIELRNTSNPLEILSSRAALLQADGDIVDTDGISAVIFNVVPDDYLVAIRQNDHLAIMSANGIALSCETEILDFTNNSIPTFGTAAQKEINSVLVLKAINDSEIEQLPKDTDEDGVMDTEDCAPTNPMYTVATTWYADIDGDGGGDPSESIESCLPLAGYVANSTDTCPSDINKLDPGTCGCGKVDTGCDPRCNAPEYDASTTYETTGTIVRYDGRLYKSKWYTLGHLPTNGGPWKFIGVCDGSTVACFAYEVWDAGRNYQFNGTKVSYNGNAYKNNWGTLADIPSESDAWELIGVCDGFDPTLSIGSTFTTEKFNIYPTKVSTELFVESSSNSTAILYDVTGKQLGAWSMIPGKNSIDMSKRTNGLYILTIEHEGKLYKTFKVLK